MLGRHCPFLNRNDARCAAHFAVNRLSAAFDHCFGDYGVCASYKQLLSERTATLTIRGRHADSSHTHRPLADVAFAEAAAHTAA